jgi:hypothetical protein
MQRRKFMQVTGLSAAAVGPAGGPAPALAGKAKLVAGR